MLPLHHSPLGSCGTESSRVSVRSVREHMFVARASKRGPRDGPGVTREAVRRLFEAGLAVADIARTLEVSKSTVCYHARALGIQPERKYARRYDWGAIQEFYDEGNSITDCCREFGLSKQAWHEAVRRGHLTSRPAAAPLATYLRYGRRTNRSHLKQRLLAAGIKEHRCEECGLTEWRGAPLFLCLHHLNGDGLDNRLENLQILCPNCHVQTPNFGSLNRGRPAQAA